MDSNWIVFALVLVTNALLALILAVLLWRKHAAPGRNSMIWMLIMLAVWAFSYAMITTSPMLEDKILWLKLENIGILTVPVFWFLFTIQYAQFDGWLNKFTGALLFVIPAMYVLLDALRREDAVGFRRLARLAPGYKPMAACGLELAADGVTSLAEVMRIASEVESFDTRPGDEPTRIVAKAHA